MNKKDKLLMVLFAISLISIVAALLIKIFGLSWFSNLHIEIAWPMVIQYIISTILLMAQFYLIAGCVLRLSPKELFIKTLPFMPLNIMIYFFPASMHFVFCFFLMFACCFTLSPKFSTVIRLVLNILIVCVIQIAIIWLKFNLESLIPVRFAISDVIVYNIDQLILLTVLYYYNRKRGDMHVSKLVLFRRNK